MDYNTIIRRLTPEEKIAGYIAIMNIIRRICAASKGSCKSNCVLRELGCTSFGDNSKKAEKVKDRAELAVLWEQENPTPIWSFKDEFFKNNPNAPKIEGYPIPSRCDIFGGLRAKHQEEFRNFWDAEYTTEALKLTTPENTPTPQVTPITLTAFEKKIKTKKDLIDYQYSRIAEYIPNFNTEKEAYKTYCATALRKLIQIRFGVPMLGNNDPSPENMKNMLITMNELLPHKEVSHE